MELLPTLRRRGPGLLPWSDLELLQDRLERALGGFPLRESVGESFPWAPSADFSEEDGAFVLTAELPGVEPSDVDVQVEGNVLTIRGEKKVEKEEKDERRYLSERYYGSFQRSFTLPTAADPEKVAADFRQGVLKVHIPKREEARGKKIKVEAK